MLRNILFGLFITACFYVLNGCNEDKTHCDNLIKSVGLVKQTTDFIEKMEAENYEKMKPQLRAICKDIAKAPDDLVCQVEGESKKISDAKKDCDGMENRFKLADQFFKPLPEDKAKCDTIRTLLQGHDEDKTKEGRDKIGAEICKIVRAPVVIEYSCELDEEEGKKRRVPRSLIEVIFCGDKPRS